MADNQTKKEIVLCKMFSGNYWEDENNLGYETINMFLPDKSTGESYIYLPANGDYDTTKEISHVILTQHIKTTTTSCLVKVIGVAEFKKSLLQKDIDDSKKSIPDLPDYKCISGGREFDNMGVLWEALKDENLDNGITDEHIEKISRPNKPPQTDEERIDFAVKYSLVDEKSEYTLGKVAKILNMSLEDAKNVVNQWRKQNGHREIKNLASKHLEEYIKENKINYEIINHRMSSDELKSAIYDKFLKAKLLFEIHKRQEERAKFIEYNNLPLTKLYSNNSSFGVLNILTTLEVEGLRRPKKNIYITNAKKDYTDIIREDDHVIISINRPSAEKQTTYLNCSDDERAKLINIINDNEWEHAQRLNLEKFEEGFEPSFLTRIKKEYDELSYSNLFAYFFSISSNFTSEFFNKVKINKEPLGLTVKGNVSEGRKIKDEDWGVYTTELGLSSVQREKKNIDIIVEGDEIVVIENKIKSALNGKPEKDINGDFIKNQLKKYYKYIESQYLDKIKHYFIFAPNYNPVHKDKFGEVDGVMMDEKWIVIRYEDIYEFCSAYDYKEDKNFSPHDKILYSEFLKALKVHTVDSLQNYYRDMQIRMRKLFE